MNDAKVIAELEALRLPELQAKFEEVVGEPTKSPNKKYLVRKIVDRMAVGAMVERHAAKSEDAGTPKAGTENAEEENAAEPDAAAEEETATETADHAPEAAVETDTTPEPDAPDAPATKNKPRRKKAADKTEGEDDAEPKISKLSVEELRAKHLELLGRETKSTNRTYLVWRVSQAAKGKIQAGPRGTRGPAGEKVEAKVLPMRVPTAAIAPLDEVWRKRGLRSRNEMFRAAMASYLIHVGESDLAQHFGATFTPDGDSDAE